jgi:hypothetical protein
MSTRGGKKGVRPPADLTPQRAQRASSKRVFDDAYDYSTGRRPPTATTTATTTATATDADADAADADSPPPRRARTGRFEKNIETNMNDWPRAAGNVSSTLSSSGSEMFLPVSEFELDPNAGVAPVVKKTYQRKKKGNASLAADFAVAGTDAGTTAGTTAGTDAGTTAGTDAGTTAGTDAGTDAGTTAGTDATSSESAAHPTDPEALPDVVDLTAEVSTPVPNARGKKKNQSGGLVARADLGVNSITDAGDLGPSLPIALKIQTEFKKKKGYYYDPNPMVTPSKETEDRQQFKSCLLEYDERTSPLLDSASKMSRTFVLQRALSVEELNDDSWLSSSLIDLCFSRFARSYGPVDFLPVDFAVMLSLPSSNASELFNATDILGRKLCYEKKRPMLLLYNAKNIHWILIKVQLNPVPELQLFEPMGQPTNHKRGMSYRIVPRDVVRWLDTCCPLPDKASWLSKALSAITSQQQFTSFDCGVACLLYAEKCGQNQVIFQCIYMVYRFC